MKVEDFKIYRADISMLDQFVELECICFSGDLITEYEYRRLFKRKNVRIYGLWYKTQLIASAIVIEKEHKKKCHLYSLCVHPDHRSIGLARAILSGVEQQLANLGFISIYLEVNEKNIDAYNCYIHQGYFTFGTFQKFYECGSNAIRMQKILTQKSIFTYNRLQQQLRGKIHD